MVGSTSAKVNNALNQLSQNKGNFALKLSAFIRIYLIIGAEDVKPTVHGVDPLFFLLWRTGRPIIVRLGISAFAGRRKFPGIGLPHDILALAKIVEALPGIDPGIMQVIESDANCVVANRFNFHDPDMSAPGDQLALARPMPLNLG